MGPKRITTIAGVVLAFAAPATAGATVRRVDGVPVPSPGRINGRDQLTTHGDYEVTVANRNGRITVTRFSPRSPRLAAPARAATDAACTEGWYNLEGPRWTGQLNWYYNWGTIPPYVQDPTASKDDIGQGRINMGGALNNCGLAEHTFSSNGQYQGATNLYANIDSNGNCTGNFPDGQNTVSWQHFDKSGLLAETCWTSNGLGDMTEADIAIGSNRGIVDNLPSGCYDSYDLQTIATHEWGHAYGLAHETNGVDEVMYPYANSCAYRRRLGRGDWYGMKNLYG